MALYSFLYIQFCKTAGAGDLESRNTTMLNTWNGSVHSQGNVPVWGNSAAIVQHKKMMWISIKEQLKESFLLWLVWVQSLG